MVDIVAQSHRLDVSDLRVVQKELKNQLQTLCNYIEKVGTSYKVTDGTSLVEKRKIKNDYVPTLFLNYDEDPRFMTVTSFTNPQGRRRNMRSYFNRLYEQSLGERELPIYRLRLAGGFINGKLLDPENWDFYKRLKDGCEIYRSKVVIEQEYILINSYGIGKESIYKENTISEKNIDWKHLYVYYVTDGKSSIVLLGDVYKSILKR